MKYSVHVHSSRQVVGVYNFDDADAALDFIDEQKAKAVCIELQYGNGVVMVWGRMYPDLLNAAMGPRR